MMPPKAQRPRLRRIRRKGRAPAKAHTARPATTDLDREEDCCEDNGSDGDVSGTEGGLGGSAEGGGESDNEACRGDEVCGGDHSFVGNNCGGESGGEA